VALVARDNLESQVENLRRTIAADGYPMSIGELTSLYRDGELIIRPEFQRLFRWNSLQKSRLVESILLGIPLPSIFVSQRKDGKWELVDGLQRVSTILQLQGELRGEGGGASEPLVLEGTKYLPGLEGRVWSSPDKGIELGAALKLDIKRAKFDVKILKRESSEATKFDLFQRLNSFGSSLTPQEVRSALLVGASPEFFAWLQQLAHHPSFESTVQLAPSDMDVQYDVELVLRFLVLHKRPETELTVTALRDFPQVLDDESLKLAEAYPRGADRLAKTFRATFDHVEAHGGESVFSRWDARTSAFRGAFLNSAFEIIALGLGYHIASGTKHKQDLLAVAKGLWTRPEMRAGFATGRATESRLARFVPLGRELLARR
jgi:hypothetical protein